MSLVLDDGDVRLYHGDALTVLQILEAGSVHMCVTSPPFYGLRSYLDADHVDKPLELGLEETPEAWTSKLVQVFREVRRVLRPEGTLWLEVGDSYAHSGACGGSSPDGPRGGRAQDRSNQLQRGGTIAPGLKPKDLIGAPWLLAFALRDDGWWLRSDIIWARPNPMPESVTDRPTKSHSYIFLLAKQPRYFFDQEAVREASQVAPEHAWRYAYGRYGMENKDRAGDGLVKETSALGPEFAASSRNVRSVWNIATQAFPDAHFATFPEELARRCILAGSPEGGLVLDPFVGSGTTCFVARKHGRHAIGIDLNADYLELASRRLQQLSLFA